MNKSLILLIPHVFWACTESTNDGSVINVQKSVETIIVARENTTNLLTDTKNYTFAANEDQPDARPFRWEVVHQEAVKTEFTWTAPIRAVRKPHFLSPIPQVLYLYDKFVKTNVPDWI